MLFLIYHLVKLLILTNIIKSISYLINFMLIYNKSFYQLFTILFFFYQTLSRKDYLGIQIFFFTYKTNLEMISWLLEFLRSRNLSREISLGI